jgi:hypothetical protein
MDSSSVTGWEEFGRPHPARTALNLAQPEGSLELLSDPVAKALLESANPAWLAYTWMDGSPRVVPIWFHWTGDQLVLATPPKAPKLKALAADPRVALTIDDIQWPHKVLLVRGRASVQMLDDVARSTSWRQHGISGRTRARPGSARCGESPWPASRSRPAGSGYWTSRPGSPVP